MSSSFPELTKQEMDYLYKRMKGKNLPMIEESLQKLDDQFWEALKNDEYEKADKLAKMYSYIKSIIISLAQSF